MSAENDNITDSLFTETHLKYNYTTQYNEAKTIIIQSAAMNK